VRERPLDPACAGPSRTHFRARSSGSGSGLATDWRPRADGHRARHVQRAASARPGGRAPDRRSPSRQSVVRPRRAAMVPWPARTSRRGVTVRLDGHRSPSSSTRRHDHRLRLHGSGWAVALAEVCGGDGPVGRAPLFYDACYDADSGVILPGGLAATPMARLREHTATCSWMRAHATRRGTGARGGLACPGPGRAGETARATWCLFWLAPGWWAAVALAPAMTAPDERTLAARPDRRHRRDGMCDTASRSNRA